jgi:hypothetical protein
MIIGGECQECFSITLYGCTDSVEVPTGITGGFPVFWKLESYKQVYFGSNTPNAFGILTLTNDAFSPALFIESEGEFVFTILSVDEPPQNPQCEPIMIEVCEVNYPCVSISFKQSAVAFSPSPEPPICPPVFVVVKTESLTPIIFQKAYFWAEPTNFTPTIYRWFYVNNATNALTPIPETTDSFFTIFSAIGEYTVICLAFGADKEEYLFNSITVKVL